MDIQGNINNVLGMAAAAPALSKMGNIQEELKAEKTKKSYENTLNTVTGKALGAKKYDANIMQQVMDRLEQQKQVMMFEREVTRTRRDQFKPGSKEYQQIEKQGQARKEKNFKTYEKDVKNILKGGK